MLLYVLLKKPKRNKEERQKERLRFKKVINGLLGFNSNFKYIVCYVESFQIICSIWLMQIICLFHLTKFSVEFFSCLIQYLFQTDKHIVFPSDKIYFTYILLNMNGTALVCYPNEMIPAALTCETMKMHFMLFICFCFLVFSMFSSTFAHDLFTKCSCVVVFPTQINYIVVNPSFLSYRNITSRCTMLVLDNAISYTN